MKDFEDELTELINKYSLENGSNTPDYLLSKYLIKCLHNYEKLVRVRDMKNESSN